MCPAGASRRRRAAVMRTWLIGLGVALACLIASWGVMLVLARRLPPGILRDLAAFIPDCVTTVRRLRKDPRGPPPCKGRGRDRRTVGGQPDRLDP